MSRSVIVTIDGPAGAGKSTVAKRLAARLGYRLLDTGAIYRAVAWVAAGQGIAVDAEFALAAIARGLAIEFAFVDGHNRVSVGGVDVSAAIRTPEISSAASKVSAHPEVRAALLELQRRLGEGGGVIVEGRDTGTVVFPHAEAKFFLTADDHERARRRVEELRAAGTDADHSTTMQEIRERDRRDTSRAVAPLRAADDAVKIDSSTMNLDEVVETIAREVERRASA